MKSLQDKVAIITGASRGIGRAIASVFAAQGARLVLTAKENLDALKDFQKAKIMKLDLSDRRLICSLAEETIKEFGRIDILVNNAGILEQADFESISETDLDTILNVDIKGPF